MKDWKAELPEAIIYVYDNNSNDNTVELAKKAGAVVRHEYSQGKGNVIRRMFREINAECYIMVDGDDTYPAEYGRKMAELVLDKKWIWLWEIDYHLHILRKIKDHFIILEIHW